MPASLINQNALWGVTAGLMPDLGPLILVVPVDLTGGATVIDFESEIAADKIDFIQSVFIDNTVNGTALFLTVGVTQHSICCPPNSQGIFTLLMPPGGAPVTIRGPAAKFTMQFSNIPVLTTVWKNA